VLTPRGRSALGLGLAVYLAAWALGSRPLYPLAVGLLVAVGLAWLWVRLTRGPMRLRRRAGGRGNYVEGSDVPVELELELESPIRPASVLLLQRLARVGEQATVLRRSGKSLRARLLLRSLPRGRYAFDRARVVLEDPFGLGRSETELAGGGALLVYPRLADLGALFSESGAQTLEGRRLLLRRPTGFDLHSVREYEQGESLRRVHWRTTARRGQLMVKELEDAPRDEVAVLLDAFAPAVTGDPGTSSFDVQVRAAGSILHTHVRRGRRAVLVVNDAAAQAHRLASADGDWRKTLEVLAAVEPTGRLPASALLADESNPAARALELTVVTADLSPALADRLIQRVLGRRGASLVFVDAVSFAPGRHGRRREPALLRLQAAGVPVALLRHGDDLAAVLSSRPLAAHA
jgi:uncharacterized protein (DUF58 family)